MLASALFTDLVQPTLSLTSNKHHLLKVIESCTLQIDSNSDWNEMLINWIIETRSHETIQIFFSLSGHY